MDLCKMSGAFVLVKHFLSQKWQLESKGRRWHLQIKQKELPDFIDSADTITLQNLDDEFAAAEVDSVIAELSKWNFESWNAAELLCS